VKKENLNTIRKKYFKILTSLLEIGKSITLTLNKQKAFNLIVDSIVKLIKCNSVTLRILSKDRKKLILEAGHGLTKEHLFQKEIKSTQGIAGLALREGKPIIINDISKDKRYGYFSFNKKEKIKSLVSVPLIIRRKKVGVLSVYHHKPSFYDRESAKILTLFAEQSAVALEIAQLFEELESNFLNTIRALSVLIDIKDRYTHGHSKKVQEYSSWIANELGLSERQKKIIEYSAFLHDIGKIGISPRILNKKTPLTPNDWKIIKCHPANGAEAIDRLGFMKELVPIIYHHHERYDGTGYPDNIKGHEIPLGSRILAVADAYDAMTSDRPYRKAYSTEKAIEELRKCAGTQFDPKIVDCFIKAITSNNNKYNFQNKE